MKNKDDWPKVLYMLTAYLDGPPAGITEVDLLNQYDNLPEETKEYFERLAKQVKQEDIE